MGMNNRRAFLAFLHESQGTLSDGWQGRKTALKSQGFSSAHGTLYTQACHHAVRSVRSSCLPRRMPHSGWGRGAGKEGVVGSCRNCWLIFTHINKMLSISLSIKATVKISK